MHQKVRLHKRHYKTAWHSKHLFLVYTYIEFAIYTNICLPNNQIAPSLYDLKPGLLDPYHTNIILSNTA